MSEALLPAIGVGSPLGYGIRPTELVSYARAAEDAGLDDVSMGELRGTEVFSLASAVVAATQRVRVETSIVAAVTRAPPLIAMAAATLSQLSGGRFRLGIGAGSPIVAGWHGVDFESPLRLVEHSIDMVRAALAGERLIEYGNFRLAEEMVGDVPIILSAMNMRMVELAGRKADGVILQFCGPEQAATMDDLARRARRASGNDSPFEVMVNVWAFAGDDVAAAEERFRQEIGPYLAVPTYRSAAVALSSEEEVDAAAAAWRAGGRNAAAEAVPQGLVDQLLFVLGAEDPRPRLAEFARNGCSRVRFVPLTMRHGDIAHANAVIAAVAGLR
jgi:alkanesulfonate monooxygenase SsuD/methylene tetrahydromethanopterin reductase-like flavin-dependent oxidoreductase (luciferase family)